MEGLSWSLGNHDADARVPRPCGVQTPVGIGGQGSGGQLATQPADW